MDTTERRSGGDRRGADKWDGAIEAAVMNLLAEVGRADLPGVLHVLKREGIRVAEPKLKEILTRVCREGRIDIELEEPSKRAIISLRRPFVGWT